MESSGGGARRLLCNSVPVHDSTELGTPDMAKMLMFESIFSRILKVRAWEETV